MGNNQVLIYKEGKHFIAYLNTNIDKTFRKRKKDIIAKAGTLRLIIEKAEFFCKTNKVEYGYAFVKI